jgi:hypothetical protein
VANGRQQAAMSVADHTEENDMSNRPKYIAFAVKNRGDNKKGIWTRLGAVWPTKDGEGLNIRLEALPIDFDGQLTLLPPRDNDAESFDGGND